MVSLQAKPFHLNDEQITTRVFKDSDGKVIGYYQLEPIKDGELYIYSIGVPKDLRNSKSSYVVLKSMQEEITNFAKDNQIKKVMVAKLMNQVLQAMSQTLGSQQLERLKDVLEATFKDVELIEKCAEEDRYDFAYFAILSYPISFT